MTDFGTWTKRLQAFLARKCPAEGDETCTDSGCPHAHPLGCQHPAYPQPPAMPPARWCWEHNLCGGECPCLHAHQVH